MDLSINRRRDVAGPTVDCECFKGRNMKDARDQGPHVLRNI